MAAATYAYKAVDLAGMPQKGEIAGASKQAVTDALKEQGLVVMDLVEKKTGLKMELSLKPKPKTVTGEGTVVAIRPDRQQVVVEHGEIKDFMDAMTMGYKVVPASLLTAVKPGDKVRFTIDTAAKTITKIDRMDK